MSFLCTSTGTCLYLSSRFYNQLCMHVWYLFTPMLFLAIKIWHMSFCFDQTYRSFNKVKRNLLSQVCGQIILRTTVGPCLLNIQWLYRLLVPARLRHVKIFTMCRSTILIMFSTFNFIIAFKKFQNKSFEQFKQNWWCGLYWTCGNGGVVINNIICKFSNNCACSSTHRCHSNFCLPHF